MGIHPTQLELRKTKEKVTAELHDDLPLDVLFEAEEIWAPERVRFLRDCVKGSVKLDALPQSLHWNWSLKAIQIPGFTTGPLSPFRLFGLRAEGAWQGLLIGCCVGHLTKCAPSGKDLVYVDFVESAPWNWVEAKAGRFGHLKGVGRQLVELAVRWSLDLDFKGRVGLHSLPQSAVFYRGCGMTDLDLDNGYKPPLRYFEFTEIQAETFLSGEPKP